MLELIKLENKDFFHSMQEDMDLYKELENLLQIVIPGKKWIKESNILIPEGYKTIEDIKNKKRWFTLSNEGFYRIRSPFIKYEISHEQQLIEEAIANKENPVELSFQFQKNEWLLFSSFLQDYKLIP